MTIIEWIESIPGGSREEGTRAGRCQREGGYFRGYSADWKVVLLRQLLKGGGVLSRDLKSPKRIWKC